MANAPIGDGGPAVNAFIGQVGNITVDAAGNLYIWDATRFPGPKVNTAGIISSVTATVGQLKELGRRGGLGTDSAGNLYIGDTQSFVVRKVDRSGVNPAKLQARPPTIRHDCARPARCRLRWYRR